MACRDAPSFEEYVREWMYGTKTEAAQEIWDLARDGTSLSDAVALAIESLPARKSAQLRRLVELFFRRGHRPRIRLQQVEGYDERGPSHQAHERLPG